jgi:hypothetical protein
MNKNTGRILNIVNVVMLVLLLAIGGFWGASIFVYKRAQPMYRIAQYALHIACSATLLLTLFENWLDDLEEQDNLGDGAEEDA